MVEFTDGDYVVRIRHAQRARQQQQEEQRNRSGTGGGLHHVFWRYLSKLSLRLSE